MKQGHQPLRACFLVAATLAIVTSPAVVSAQSKCDAGRIKTYVKKVGCLGKVDAKAAQKGEPVDTVKEQKCVEKFTEKCAKAEEKDDCTGAVKSCAELATEADTCRDASVGSGTTTTTTTTTTLSSSACGDTDPVCDGSCPNSGTCLDLSLIGGSGCGCTPTECDLVEIVPGAGSCVGNCDVSGGACVCDAGICVGGGCEPFNPVCPPGLSCWPITASIGICTDGNNCVDSGDCSGVAPSCFCGDGSSCYCQ